MPPQSRASESPADPWWLRRPSSRAALATTALCAALAAAGGWLAAQGSPLAARSLLPIGTPGTREVFLTTLLDEPRVALTTRRSLTSMHRGEDDPAGSRYWLHRYGDPDRPELPDRVLLTSRRRGARLYVPVGALDLERALATALGEEPALKGGGGAVPSELVHLYLDRLFAGAFLELRFPDREMDPAGEPLRFDLVAIRGNRVRNADFVLTPNPRYYRAALIEGDMPRGEFRVAELASGPELVFAFYADLSRAAEPLYLPVSLFDELGLAWGDAVPTLVDDRWRIEELPRYATAPPLREVRDAAARAVAVHLAARFEPRPERERLARDTVAWLAR